MFGIPFLDNAIKALRPTLFDDVVDRLNYYFTTLFLIFFAILVSAKQYVGKPIQCWVPAQFRGGWEQYIEDYCFVQNTYFIPFEDVIPSDSEVRSEQAIGYYQWVPIVLAVQALLFYLPHFIWTSFNRQSGLNLSNILKIASSAEDAEPDKREKTVQKLSVYVSECMGVQRQLRSHHWSCQRWFCVGCVRRNGFYVTGLYLFIKFLYLANIVGQFFMLNNFLGTEYDFWGLQIFMDLIRGREWSDSGHFPRVTLCDFKIRKIGQVHKHTVQCVLMINMFNEKIYLFLWFWFLFIAVCTGINCVYWICTIGLSSSRRKFLHKYLRISSSVDDDAFESKMVKSFASSAVRSDGVLILRFIANHVGDMVAIDLTGNLWKQFLQQHKEQLEDRYGHSASPSSKSTYAHEKDPGLIEEMYNVEQGKPSEGTGLMVPSAPVENGTLKVGNGYPGPPPGFPPHMQA